MKCIDRKYGRNMDPVVKQDAKAKAADVTRTRGTDKKPQPPRDILCQPGSRGALITWNLPAVYFDIQKWRVYSPNESTLVFESGDRGTRQYFLALTSGTTPPVTNVFVSSLNNMGIESQRVQAQASATAETGAPSIPSVPPGYTSGGSGGGNKTTDYQSIIQNIRQGGINTQ